MKESDDVTVDKETGSQAERRGFLRWLGGLVAGGFLLAKFNNAFGQVKRGVQTSPSTAAPGPPAAPQGSNPFLGEIELVAFNFAPVGWAFCDGQILPISQNTALFSLLGTTYGGDGITTFALPNLQGRVPIHMGQGPGLTSHIIGEVGGEEAHTLISQEMPSHTHALAANSGVGSSDDPSGALPAKNAAGIPQYSSGSSTTMSPQAVGSAGGGEPHYNMQPYLTLNYIIALAGIYPARS